MIKWRLSIPEKNAVSRFFTGFCFQLTKFVHLIDEVVPVAHQKRL